jgi:hypothetical protein
MAMKKSNFALRLQPSLMEEARRIAKDEGVAVNQLINVAVAEKIAALRTAEYFAERVERGDVQKALRILKRSGVSNPVVPGDELPSGLRSRRTLRSKRPSPVDQQLRFAIAHKRLIQFSYAGARRVAEPHDYGIQSGVAKLLVYQRRASGRGAVRHRAKGWRLLEVSKIVECSILDEAFEGSRSEQHQHLRAWDVVYARVG